MSIGLRHYPPACATAPLRRRSKLLPASILMISPTSNRPAATAVTEKNTNRSISANDESQSHQKPLDTKIPIQVRARGWSIGLPRPLMPLVLTPALLAPLLLSPLRSSPAAIVAVLLRLRRGTRRDDAENTHCRHGSRDDTHDGLLALMQSAQLHRQRFTFRLRQDVDVLSPTWPKAIGRVRRSIDISMSPTAHPGRPARHIAGLPRARLWDRTRC